MSSIDTIRDKNGRPIRYKARYRTPDGKSRKQTFDRKVDAENFLTNIERSKLVGQFVDPAEGRITFAEYAATWAEQQPHRDTTKASIEVILRKHIIPTFGAKRLSSIRTSDVQAWIVALGRDEYDDDGTVTRRGLSPATIELVYGKLAGIMRAAVTDQRIARTPCDPKAIRLPRDGGGEVVPMTPEQVATMADAVGSRYYALVVLIAGTGLRPGEAVGLTADRIDWLRRRLRVDRQLVTIANEAPRMGPVKTSSSNRTIAVPQAVLDVLARHIELHGLGPHGLIFTDSKGDPLRRNAMGHIWRRAAAKVGIDGYSWHDLRHYAASMMIERGSSVKAVQKQLGHQSATTTLDTYAHLWPDAEDTTRAALDAGLAHVVSIACPPAAAAEAK